MIKAHIGYLNLHRLWNTLEITHGKQLLKLVRQYQLPKKGDFQTYWGCMPLSAVAALSEVCVWRKCSVAWATKVALEVRVDTSNCHWFFKVKGLKEPFDLYPCVSSAEAQYPAVFKNTWSFIWQYQKKELIHQNLLKTKRQLFITYRKIFILHVLYALLLIPGATIV